MSTFEICRYILLIISICLVSVLKCLHFFMVGFHGQVLWSGSDFRVEFQGRVLGLGFGVRF